MQPHALAMSSAEHSNWLAAIIVGLVVVVAVAALLSLLIYLHQDHRPPGRRGPGHAARPRPRTPRTRADPAGRRRRGGGPGRGPAAPPVPRPRARKGEVMTALVVLTVVDIVLLVAGPGVLPVLGRHAAHPDRRQPRGVRRARARRSWATPSSSGPAWSTSTRPAAWSPGRCRCCTGWPRRSSPASPRGPRHPPCPSPPARPPARRRSRLHDAVGFVPAASLNAAHSGRVNAARRPLWRRQRACRSASGLAVRPAAGSGGGAWGRCTRRSTRPSRTGRTAGCCSSGGRSR